ncbi:thermostable hemolysin [Methylophaga pinxianii]|uniref:thermostable hemolysin n=1 Tax=Methylophaga pinxianii TaxID=2881052 RepID=UPI001CF3ACA0|nr:thermostable hemolysin [Methylophaga pinxianii]MCB2427589.1 thermostable hemolysin [Methylophaga pinxianii]UPH44591.1 thermostable hemolysin [Methylophaga pinxianii]
MEATTLQNPTHHNEKTWQQRLLFPHKSLSLIDEQSSEQSVVKAFISKRFNDAFGAEIQHFLPYFLTSQMDGLIDSAIGFQPVQQQSLFLEQYLSHPVEKTLKLQGIITNRAEMVEIGNLAASFNSGSPLLFILLAAVLHQANYQWVVFTATRQVRHLIDKLQLSTISLGVADPQRLVDKNQQWGSYYLHQPVVLAGHLSTAIAHLRQHQVIQSLLVTYQDFIDKTAEMIAR